MRMDHIDMFLLVILVFTELLGVFSQGIPADRTFTVCTGSRVAMTFEGATYKPNNFPTWHFTPPGSEETDVAYLSGDTLKPIKAYEGYGLERIGKQGFVIPNISAEDSGLYRYVDDLYFKYNVTVLDPCFNTTNAAPQGDKTCLDVTCITKATFVRLLIENGNVTSPATQNPYTLCGTSPVNVTCIVNQGGQESMNKTLFNLSSVSKDENGGLGGGEFAGIVAGIVAVVAIIGTVTYCVLKRRDNSRG